MISSRSDGCDIGWCSGAIPAVVQLSPRDIPSRQHSHRGMNAPANFMLSLRDVQVPCGGSLRVVWDSKFLG